MTADTDHAEIESLLGAYALDAVDPEEAARVGRHLETCPHCRAEVDSAHEVAGRLGTSARVDDAEPLPPGLWDRIAGGLGAPAERAPGPMPGLGGPPEGVGRVAEISHARTRRAGRWASLVAAAAAVAAIAVLGVGLANTSTQLDQARRALSGRGDTGAVRAAMATPARRLVRMDSAEGAQLAEFVVLPDGQGYLVSSSMPSLPSDETYQLWALIGGQPISVGLLGSRPDQAAFTLASTSQASALAVTVEPAGGVTTPDRSPVAKGNLA